MADKFLDRANGNLIIKSPISTSSGSADASKIASLGSDGRFHNTMVAANCWHGVVRTVASSAALPTHVASDGIFSLAASGNSFDYYYNGTRVNVSSNKSISVSGQAAGVYYVYFNGTTGNLAYGSFPGLTVSSNVIIASITWNGSTYGLVNDEMHSHNRSLTDHLMEHLTVGCRYSSGIDILTLGGTGQTSFFTTSGGAILDEDIYFTIGASSTFPTPNAYRIFYQTSATTYAFDTATTTVPYKADPANSYRPQYVRNDTYALVTLAPATNRYLNYFCYATTDKHTPIYILAETASNATLGVTGYTSVALARAVVFPNLGGAMNVNGISREFRPIYRIIVRADGVVQSYSATDDYRTATSLPMGAGTSSTSASGVSFVPYGNIQSSNLQSALEELDTEKIGLTGAQTFTGAQRSTVIILTDGATITPDFSLGNLYQVVLGGNRTIAMPTNLVEGQQGTIKVIQDISGGRALTWGGSTGFPYEWYGGTAMNLSPDPLSVDQVVYSVDIYKTSTATITIGTNAQVTFATGGTTLYRGQRVHFTTTGSLPTGLSANTNYWLTPTSPGSNVFYLSTSLANCKSSTYITTSGTQSGTHTCIACSIVMSINNGFI